MKRETKKKIVNITLASAITSSVLTPISIVLGKHANDQITLNNKRILEKDTQTNEEHLNEISQINEDFTFDLEKFVYSSEQVIAIGNPNITKAIPNGYVVVIGDSYGRNKKIVCLDKKNPSRKLWEIVPNKMLDLNVYSIEYTPYDGGTIVILYSHIENDKVPTTNSNINYAIYKNVDKQTPTLFKSSSFFDNSITKPNGRLDTWTLSPILGYSSSVTKYFAYCKDITKENSSSKVPFFLISLEENSSSLIKKFELDLSTIIFGIKGILSTLILEHKKNHFFISNLIIDSSNKLRISSINSEPNSNVLKSYSTPLELNLSLNKDNDYLVSLIESSVNSVGLHNYTKDNLDISFFLNYDTKSNADSKNKIHSNSFFVKANIGKAVNDNDRLVINGPIENKNIGDSKTEIFNGYFINDSIISEGYKNKNSFSFIGVGKSDDFVSDNNFIVVIKNIFDSNFSFNENLNEPNWRIYKMNENSKSNKENAYSGWKVSSIDTNEEIGLGFKQGEIGLPILDYFTIDKNIFDQNIFLTKNGSNKAIIVNQKHRGQDIKNKASYGYQTRIKTQHFVALDLFSSNKIKDLDKEKIKSEALSNIKKFIFNKSSSIQLSLVENDTLKIDYDKGILEFTFKMKNYFNEKGVLEEKDTELSIRVEQFELAVTKLKDKINIYNEKYKNSLNETSSVFVPSLNLINDTSSNEYWNLREIVWKALLSNELFVEDSLKKNPVEGDSVQQNRDNFNKFFTEFKWTKFDNKEGIIYADFVVSNEYSFKSDGAKFSNVKFWGLRKIGDTKIFPINSSSPLENKEWETINIPYVNNNSNEIVSPNNLPNDVKIITKEELKKWIINNVFKEAYSRAEGNNGFSATKDLIVDNLPYKKPLEAQNGKTPNENEYLDENDIELSNFSFYPAKGMLSFDISLKVWYKDGEYYDNKDSNSNPPKEKWHVSGFRKDNVTTFIDENNVWKIDSISGILASQSLERENINFVKTKILEYGYKNNRISFPYWVNLKSLSLDDFKLVIKKEEIDDTFGSASFNIFIKNGMFEAGDDGSIIEIKEEDGYNNWKTIKISGFSNKDAILIDSSKFWDKSSSVYNERIIYDIKKESNNEFDNFLAKTEEAILNYIAEEDAKKRPNDIQETAEEWKEKIVFQYFLDNSSVSYNRLELQKQINIVFSNTVGKFNFFYNTKNNLGIKIWIKIAPKNSSIKLPLNDSSLDQSKGKELKGLLNTSGITMSFDLEQWFINLEKNRGTIVKNIDIDSSTISSIVPPTLTNSSYSGYNINFGSMEFLLKSAGYKFEYSWKDANNNDVTSDSLPTNFSFNLIENKIKLKVSYSLNEINSKKESFPFYIFYDSSSNNIKESYEKTITLSLALFSILRVDLNDLQSLSFEGTTNNLDNFESIKTKEEQLISKIKEENKKIANNDETKIKIDNLNIDVLYSINKEILNPNSNDDKIWATLEEMKEILSSSKINFSSNKVYAKYVIKWDSSLNSDVDFKLSNENEFVINVEELTSSAKFKVYIHPIQETNSDWIFNNLKLQGSQTDYEITKYNEWIKSLPKGLSVQFNVSKTPGYPDKPNDDKWSYDYRKEPISNTKEYWIRLKVKDGFIFDGTYSEYLEPIKLDTTKISVVLKLESNWLASNIELSGNIKNLSIDETKIRNYLDINNLNPINIIKIQYTVIGLEEWFEKEAFEKKLIELNGSLNDDYWIIKREDIKARFVIDKEINNELLEKYYLEVDGIFIDKEEETPISSLITDKYNVGVKGYINVDKLSSFFVANNFEVIGTNNQAILLTKNVNELNKLISKYSLSNVFKLLYTNNVNNNFDNVRNSIINNSGLIEEYTYLNGNFSERYFALSFRGSEHYEVYENDKKLDNGYVLSSPSISVNIRIEIENPFIGNEVSIKFLAENNQPIFYQGDGGFDVLIKDNDSSNNKNFSDFISSLSVGVGQNQWTQEQKDAMELVYFVSNRQLTDDELKKIIKYDKMYEEGDQNQKYGVWKILDPTNKRENLNLLVNDYVTIAIRVKKDKLNSEGVNFIMKEYENFIPHQKRVYGYKVQASSIAIDFDSLTLKNVGQAESSSFGLDGYAQLKSISLKKDEKKHYLGVSLKLNYFTDFHKNSNNEVLVSGSGERLVKRNSNGAIIKGYYKDKNGKEILNDKGERIPILEKSGLLSEPIKSVNLTRSKQLLDLGNGVFTLQLSNDDSNAEYSFFKKQLIEFEISNKKGDALGEEYDYYMDESFNNKVTYILDKEIKTPIPNEKNIKYEFNSKEFIEKIIDPANLFDVYKNSYDPNQLPITGQSQIVSMFSITRTENNGNELTLDTLEKIQNQISIDFDGKVILRATYYSLDGKVVVIDGGDISQIKELKNGDRFKIEIISANEDNWIFANQPNPLVFTISGLFEKLIEKSILKNLRVKQSGEFNGEGNFQIYVNDPKEGNATSSLEDILGGYYFLIRVWDDKKTIKHNWTKQFSSITDLKNGDKVEWKLVSHNGSPLYEAYHNTIANPDNHNANENVYSFSIVNQSGPSNSNITEPIEGIGINPSKEDEYPENSGFTISGLKEKEDSSYTTISFEEFTRLMNLMNFSYIGPNGSGDMISNKSILDVEVNTIGKSSTKFTLDYLINNNYLQFYYNNNTSTQLNSFNWNQVKDENGHWLTSPGTLSNGDIVKIRYKDPSMSGYYEYDAPVVSGLKDKVDNMSMFTWIGIGLATFVTLGIFALVYLHSTKKKLK